MSDHAIMEGFQRKPFNTIRVRLELVVREQVLVAFATVLLAISSHEMLLIILCSKILLDVLLDMSISVLLP